MRLNAKQILAYTGGSFAVEPIDASELMCYFTWDSREVQQGSLFACLPGERVDGHSFAADVLRAGARGLLVSQPLPKEICLLARELGAAVIEVPNTQAAIVDLALEWRSHLRGKVIAITGSVGKTTTKNLVRDVLSARGSVVATLANQNNELGVPRTILNANPETEAVVVEMGMRGLGQIASLCEIVRPDWALITNVGESHIELLGTRENIARAKAEVLSALPSGIGCVFLNEDDEMSDFMWQVSGAAPARIKRIGFSASPEKASSACADSGRACVWAQDITLDEQGHPYFTLCASGFPESAAQESAAPETSTQSVAQKVPAQETHACKVGLRGVHNVANACAAAAIGRAFNMSLEAIACALEAALPEAGRQEVLRGRAGFTIINDAYNANPDSMRAALSTFSALEVTGRRIAVLGDMGELGKHAKACHESVGKYAATCKLDKLICAGELARFIASGAQSAGMDAARITCVATPAQVLADLDASLDAGDCVLIKASHFMELNRVVDALLS